jgi:hypothetical protein
LKKAVTLSVLFACVLSVYTFLSWENETEQQRSPASVPQNYDALKACEKQDLLWGKASSTVYKDLPVYKKFGVFQLLGMSLQELQVKGNRFSDFAPDGWKKYLHRRGALAKVKIVSKDHRYTGIFQGADCALLRLSLTYKVGGGKPVAPGLALKVLRDGVPSANISALVSLDGQGSEFNFFHNPMSNIVPMSSGFGQKLVHKLFKKVSRYPEELVSLDMAQINARGEKVKGAVAPRQIFFVPGSAVKFQSEEHDVREDFITIPEGTVVYQIYALSEKHKDFDYGEYSDEKAREFLKDSTHIGDIVSTSEFVSSQFGDDGIFFRHQFR